MSRSYYRLLPGAPVRKTGPLLREFHSHIYSARRQLVALANHLRPVPSPDAPTTFRELPSSAASSEKTPARCPNATDPRQSFHEKGRNRFPAPAEKRPGLLYHILSPPEAEPFTPLRSLSSCADRPWAGPVRRSGCWQCRPPHPFLQSPCQRRHTGRPDAGHPCA